MTTKLELLTTNAAILFNKLCKTKQLTPKYFSIKNSRNNNQSKNTRLAAIKYRINQEIKFLYCKKQKLSERLYHVRLERSMLFVIIVFDIIVQSLVKL